MTTPMTRRELRELERVAVTNEPRVPAPIEQQVLSQVPFRDQSLDRASESSEHFEVASPLLTRRQMREQGLLGSTAEANSSNFVDATNLTLPLSRGARQSSAQFKAGPPRGLFSRC